jgi:predicted TIM-barrel fold metal-dependent hydrolase
MRIDVHSHYNPPDYFAALRAVGGWDELSIFRALGHIWKPGSATAVMGADKATLKRRLDDMDASKIDKQILSIGAAQPYLKREDDAARIARALNDAYAALLAEAPSRLLAFAMLPLPHVEASLAELDGALARPGVVGVALGASAQGVPLDDARFSPLWAELNRRHAVAYVHPGSEITGVIGCTEFHLAPDFVSPAEIAVCAGRMVATGLLDRYPNVLIVLATLGGGLPFLARRFDRGLKQDYPELHERIGGVLRHLRRFYVDTSVTEEPDALRAAKETFGADRILLGSDYARPNQSTSDAVTYVANSNFLTLEEKEAVLEGNATKLFGS